MPKHCSFCEMWNFHPVKPPCAFPCFCTFLHRVSFEMFLSSKPGNLCSVFKVQLRCHFHWVPECFEFSPIRLVTTCCLSSLAYLSHFTWVPGEGFQLLINVCWLPATPTSGCSQNQRSRHRASFQNNHTPLLCKVIPWDFCWAFFSSHIFF